MVPTRAEKIAKAIKNLEQSIRGYERREQGDDLPFLALCKTVEVLVEYLWKELKQRVEAEGLFAVSPKEAVRQAAVLGLISEPDRWIKIILARNDSVHDYFGIPESDYVALANELLEKARAFK
jgi:hypothetical protein